MATLNARDWANLYVKEVIHKYNPNFEIRPKSQSWIFKLLKPVINFINPTFFSSFITTLFGTMWVPDNFFDRPSMHVLRTTAHEGRHEYDRKRLFFGVFEIMYSFPQNLFVPFFILGLAYSCWWFIPAVLFLLPLPAPFRYKLEMDGYAMSRIWNKYVFSDLDEWADDDHVIDTLSSLNTYYATWPFKKMIQKDLYKPLNEHEPGFADTIAFLERHGLKDKKVFY